MLVLVLFNDAVFQRCTDQPKFNLGKIDVSFFFSYLMRFYLNDLLSELLTVCCVFYFALDSTKVFLRDIH